MRGVRRRGNHGSGPNDAVLERTVPFQTGERRHIVLIGCDVGFED